MFSSDFKKLILSRFLSTTGLQIQSVVLGWQLYILTHSPFYLGLIGLAQAVPALGLALFSGYIVDRNRPLPIFKAVIGLMFISNLIVVLSHYHGFHFGHTVLISSLFVSSFLVGTGRAFMHPCMFSVVPRIVDRQFSQQASAWMTSSFQTASISGPALGGILFGLIGIFWTSTVVSLLLIASLGMLILFRADLGPAHIASPDTFKKELLSGATFVRNHPILLPALSLDMVAVLFGGVTALLPIYAAEVLHVGPMGLGILRAAPAVGAVLVSLWLTKRDIQHRAGTWLLWGVGGFGISILIFAISHSFVISLLALLASGGFDSVSAVVRTSIVQLSSPDHMRGRISAINMMFISTSNELGEFESGMAAALLGTIPTAVFGGVICLVAVAGVAYFSTTLRRLNLSRLRQV